MKKLAILSAIMWAATIGVTARLWTILKEEVKEQAKLSELSDKHLNLFLLLNQWLKTKQEEKEVVEYFHRNGIKSIAIYGMGCVGERLCEELINSDIEIKYVIDKQLDKTYAGVQTVLPDGNLPEVGAIVVTAIFYFDEIKNTLENKTGCRIISLEDILYGI